MVGIKILICIAIVCITSYMGIELASSLNKREKILIDMVTFLKLVQNEKKYIQKGRCSRPLCADALFPDSLQEQCR